VVFQFGFWYGFEGKIWWFKGTDVCVVMIVADFFGLEVVFGSDEGLL
jgi:hypothetical protein